MLCTTFCTKENIRTYFNVYGIVDVPILFPWTNHSILTQFTYEWKVRFKASTTIIMNGMSDNTVLMIAHI